MDQERRVLLFTPTGRDAPLIASVLRHADIDCFACAAWTEVGAELDRGVAAIMFSEETLVSSGIECLHAFLASQPNWSDLPLLLLTAPRADSPAVRKASETMGNLTLLERPTRIASLISAARAALRARTRQYQSRSQLIELELAARALGASEQQLREAHTRKDEFLATLAHELRNPLAPIRNALYILRRKGQDASLAPLHEIVDRQLNQLVRLVDDLMEVSRITRGKIELHMEELDIGSVLRSAIETSRPLIEAARHELRVDLPDVPLRVKGDALRLAQVFANLLNNAAKYTDEGGTITVRASVEGRDAVISVRDSGIGISADMLPSIFEMFTQVPGSTERAQGGLGIGLTLVRSLVELHEGRVSATSEGPGLGSEFTVRLKLAPERSSVHLPPSAPVLDLPVLQRRMIVVDDNRDAADTLAMVLRSFDADVQVVYNAEDALNLLRPGSNEVVLADIGMPDVDGYELARRIRADSTHASVRLVAMSGWGQQQDHARSKAAGFDFHLTKPADLETLTTLLASFESNAEARPQRFVAAHEDVS